MTRHFCAKASLLLAALLAGSVAWGQPPRPGGPGMGRPPEMSVVITPLPALKAGLKLTAAQTARIDAIRRRRLQRIASSRLTSKPGASMESQFKDFQALSDKMRALEQKDEKDIVATLTATQKQALPGLLRRLFFLNRAGIPMEMYGTLNLTAVQHQKLAAIVNRSDPRTARGYPPGGWTAAKVQSLERMQEQAMAVLTADQRKAVTAYKKAHPHPRSRR